MRYRFVTGTTPLVSNKWGNTMTPEAKALAFANAQGYQTTYNEARDTQLNLEDHLAQVPSVKNEKRITEQYMLDRDIELLLTVRKNLGPTASQASVEREHKIGLNVDPEMKRHRSDLRLQQLKLDDLESGIKSCEFELRLLTGRLNQMGGYFNYLAAVKSAASPGPVAAWP
jgi:hypothetical protein